MNAFQIGSPAEEDLKSWGQHTSTSTVPDAMMRTIGQQLPDQVSFVFSCKANTPSGSCAIALARLHQILIPAKLTSIRKGEQKQIYISIIQPCKCCAACLYVKITAAPNFWLTYESIIAPSSGHDSFKYLSWLTMEFLCRWQGRRSRERSQRCRRQASAAGMPRGPQRQSRRPCGPLRALGCRPPPRARPRAYRPPLPRQLTTVLRQACHQGAEMTQARPALYDIQVIGIS